MEAYMYHNVNILSDVWMLLKTLTISGLKSEILVNKSISFVIESNQEIQYDHAKMHGLTLLPGTTHDPWNVDLPQVPHLHILRVLSGHASCCQNPWAGIRSSIRCLLATIPYVPVVLRAVIFAPTRTRLTKIDQHLYMWFVELLIVLGYVSVNRTFSWKGRVVTVVGQAPGTPRLAQ